MVKLTVTTISAESDLAPKAVKRLREKYRDDGLYEFVFHARWDYRLTEAEQQVALNDHDVCGVTL